MSNSFSPEFKKGFWTALYEFIIITMPVGIYVYLEAYHKNDWTYLYSTPEWSIATIFLAFISLSRYLMTIGKSGKTIFQPIIGLFGVLVLIIIIAATLNAKISIEKESQGAVNFRIVLFCISTAIFFIFITGTSLIKKQDHV